MSASQVRDSSTGKKINYGWVVVGIGFIIWTFAFGIQYSFSIFFKPLQEALGWSRATTSWAMTLHLLVYGLCTFIAGWSIDRLKVRYLYVLAAVLIGPALMLSSRISEPWQLYLLYSLPLAMGISFCGSVIHTIVARWFIKNRGLALGIVSCGAGFGTLVLSPFSNWLITTYGWRDAYVILGAISLVALLVCSYFMRAVPAYATNQESAGESSGSGAKLLTPSGMTLSQALRTRELYLITASSLFFTFTLRMIMVHIVPYATDVGISPSAAALGVGMIGTMSIVGRLVMGFFQDRIGAQRSMYICMAVQGLTMLALPFIRSDLLFFIFAIVFGFMYGGDVPQTPAITAQYFGLASMGTIYGLIVAVSNGLGGAVGPITAGYIFDLTGTYTVAFLGAAFSLFVGLFCIWRVKLPASR